MAKRKRSTRNGHYGAYTFTEKDPVISELMGMSTGYFGHDLKHKDLAAITKNGGPSTTAMRNWFWGGTKRPQNCTVEAAGRAMNMERVWRKMRRNVSD